MIGQVIYVHNNGLWD